MKICRCGLSGGRRFMDFSPSPEIVKVALHLPMAGLFVERVLDPRARLAQWLNAAGMARDEAGDMKAEHGAEDRGDFTGIESENRIVELIHHIAARERAQIAATARTIGKGIRHHREILPRG